MLYDESGEINDDFHGEMNDDTHGEMKDPVNVGARSVETREDSVHWRICCGSTRVQGSRANAPVYGDQTPKSRLRRSPAHSLRLFSLPSISHCLLHRSVYGPLLQLH